MTRTLTWHGHANFQIQTPEVNILVDPFFEGNPVATTPWENIPRPDLILVTHDHADHVGQTVELARRHKAMVGAVTDTARVLALAGVPAEQILNNGGFNIGGTMPFRGVRVTMTPAVHTSNSGAPVGYILTLEDGFTLYHAGDTSVFSDMALWGELYRIDLALLPVGGVFTMDARQAALACSMLGCAKTAPMHWGTFPALAQNTAAFRAEVAEAAPGVEVLDLTPGKPVPF